jgi:hypothetical protein
MLTSLLALSPDLPVRDTGSAGGLYGPSLFDAFERPFVDSPRERQMRLFAPYVRQLKQPHFACVGRDDGRVVPIAEHAADIVKSARVPLDVRFVDGDHFTSGND